MRGHKYFNILIGTIEVPEITYLIDCKYILTPPNASIICQYVDDAIKDMGIGRNDFLLLLSDAARYMISAGITLKVMIPNLFTVTCVAHLLHNCALRIRSQFKDVDNLISSIKAVTVKNKFRQSKFRNIGLPPQPVLTRWGSWIDAALYYSENFIGAFEIVNSFQDGGILAERAKDSICSETLKTSLLSIHRDYSCLSKLIS